MKRRSFLKNSTLAAGTALSVSTLGMRDPAIKTRSMFELRVYHISRADNAKNRLEKYFTDALIPYLSRHNVKFGAFNEYSLEEPVKLYTLLAYPDVSAYLSTQDGLLTEDGFLKASEAYNRIPASEAVFSRYETFLLEAFETIPAVVIPSEKKNLFELRTYESANEDAGRRKIAMFDKEEIALFLKVGLNPVFFGKILAGQYMPALTYMVGFKDMADRDASWNKFGGHEEWKMMSAKPEYAHTVSNIHKIFLTPAAYSQI